uniref:Uncharacterized protein n=1 Tax=Anopheles merus TaxID=30066 RepID=A0A182VBZ8_ANOME
MESCLQTWIGGPGTRLLMANTPRSSPFAVMHCGWKQCARLPRRQFQQALATGAIHEKNMKQNVSVHDAPLISDISFHRRCANEQPSYGITSFIANSSSSSAGTIKPQWAAGEEDRAAAAKDASSSEEEDEGVRKGSAESCPSCSERCSNRSSSSRL